MTAPILVLDSREKWGPVAVEEILDVPGVKLITSAHKTQTVPSLELLPAEGGRLNFPGDMKPVLMRPGVGYHRVVAQAGLFWHQYWLAYLFNPKKYAGYGEHEFDWEFVQFGCVDKAGGLPVLATASQHHTGGKREVWRMVKRDGRPVFYVARDSHANYFTPTKDVEDTADGRGLVLDKIEWRPFGAWASWPGRWGNSDNSPESPGRQTTRWDRPAIFHGQAR